MIIPIDLASPWTIAIITGIILMFITGAWNFAKILFAKQIIDKKFFDLFSEMQTLQRDYEEQISQINKDKKQEIEKTVKLALNFVSKRVDEIIKHNQPPIAKPKSFKEMFLNQPMPKKKIDS